MTDTTELDALAREIADEAAKQTLDTWARVELIDYKRWLHCPGGRTSLRSFRYLELRGLLEHHPERPELVRVKI